MDDPARILFVCTGNICRSAYAERYARWLAASHGWAASMSSAGTEAVVGAGIDPLMGDLAPGTPTCTVARQLTTTMVRESDLVLCMERAHQLWVLDLAVRGVRVWTLGQLGRAMAQSGRGGPRGPGDAPGWQHRIPARKPRGQEGDDVEDPYQRGEAAALQAAATIGRHLDSLLPALFN